MFTHTLTLLYKIDYDYVQVSTELIALHKLHTDLKFSFPKIYIADICTTNLFSNQELYVQG